MEQRTISQNQRPNPTVPMIARGTVSTDDHAIDIMGSRGRSVSSRWTLRKIFLDDLLWLKMLGESRMAILRLARMTEHHFGGPWTELKLDAVCYYLECCTKALSQKQFDLWYVDVFAGTGDRTNEKLTGGLLERQPVGWVTETLPGSAKRAMNIRPPFRHFIFNESDNDHKKTLAAIKEANKSLDIEIIGNDAKRDPRIRDSGRLIGFRLEGKNYPISPTTVFYDWLYFQALFPHRDWIARRDEWAGFTDIEFNPERSINCQARSFAVFISLMKRNLLEQTMSSFDEFKLQMQTASI